MTRIQHYKFEFGLIAAAMLVSVLGFWDIYLAPGAAAEPHHHLHLLTNFLWMGLLLAQLTLIARGSRATHRKLGLAVLVAAPLLVGTAAGLSVFSAYKGVTSGEGDFLIVQNVMVTLELAFLICLAFLLKKRRKLHASLLLSTMILFMGIALFFALISFAPPFKIEGPETFYRFQTAAMTGQIASIIIGTFYFFRDRQNGWPFLFAGFSFLVNEGLRALLTSLGLIDPLTAFVGSMNPQLTFVATFALMFALLAGTTLPKVRQPQLT